MEEKIEFIIDLQSLLKKHFEFEDPRTCRIGAASLLVEGINVLLQNSPNKHNFKENTLELFTAILDKWILNYEEAQ